MLNSKKPLGIKNYGHIPHLPGSRIGPGDHKCSEGQAKIATLKTRDKHDLVIVQEKVDGSNGGVAKVNGIIYALTRAGYIASSSPYEQHHYFDKWVQKNYLRFHELLEEKERICGEWLMLAHGTRYNLPHEPFVVFDIMRETERALFDEFSERVKRYDFVTPKTLQIGSPLSIESALELCKISGHGAIDPVEGAVWRVQRNVLVHPNRNERRWEVDFLVKYVRPDKQDGCYLPEASGKPQIWNVSPDQI